MKRVPLAGVPVAAPRWGIVALVAAALVCAAPAFAQGVKFDTDMLGGLEARPIGPATMSGRVTAVDAVAGDRLTIYAGTAGGGLWKSVDGGLVFKPIFDKYNQSIGAVTVDPAKPDDDLGRHRRNLGAQQRVGGRRRLPIDRRRRELDEARPRRHRADRPHPRRSARTATP